MLMILRVIPIFVALGLALAPTFSDARPRDKEQDEAFRATQQGKIMPLRTIESRVVPQMRGADYLGPELDAGSGRYRLKFLRDGRVIWVDVDARTGDIIGKSGG
jgi:uncharacterized membrane protein YkoI